MHVGIDTVNLGTKAFRTLRVRLGLAGDVAVPSPGAPLCSP